MITREPPLVRSGSYGVLEMQVDADGNDLAGIRSVFAAGADRHLYGLESRAEGPVRGRHMQSAGSFIPFAATRAERLATGDPRLSIEERYPSKEAYVVAFKKAADALVAQRYLLPEDAKLLIGRAESEGIRTAP